MAEAHLRDNRISEAFALYVQAVSACPSVHRYKEQLLDLARRGIRISYSRELEDAFAACLRTPGLAAELENWSPLAQAGAGASPDAPSADPDYVPATPTEDPEPQESQAPQLP